MIDALSHLRSAVARKQLLRWMLTSEDADLRWEATYTLIWDAHPSLADAYLEVLRRDLAGIVTLAIEGLSEILESFVMQAEDRRQPNWSRSPFYRRLTEALIPYLSHRNSEYRFWAIFALGHKARCRRVLPILEDIAANDTAVVPGWWSVAKEARDAIRHINKGLKPLE